MLSEIVVGMIGMACGWLIGVVMGFDQGVREERERQRLREEARRVEVRRPVRRGC